ncbi:MAG: MBOAT family protein, partial [Lachnospiraceae bacterium]|nr:MBOAT family protein [Lachnospiraceae bacterium]
PIERAKDLLPQIRKPRSFDPDLAIRGLKIMLIGFFEKIAIADILGIFVNRIWGDLNAASGADVLIASLFFSLQILCDFKGYSDIARGAASVLGIRLSVNFDRPYASASIAEFWRRWHITFSSWLRDYLYIPLGGARGSFLFWCRNIFIVFFVSGLWHGADLTFVAWGLLHAFFQIAERLLFTDKKGPRRLRQLLTFIAVNFAWVLFRAPDFSQAGLFFQRLLTGWQPFALSLNGEEAVVFGLSLLGFAALSLLPGRLAGAGRSRKILRYSFCTLALWLTAAAYLYLRSGGIQSSFIYFQF